MKIAIIEDHKMIADAISNVLRHQAEKYEVFVFVNGDSFLHTEIKVAFDLVITDMLMPGISSTELIQAIKEKYCSSKLIVLSSVVDMTVVKHCIRLGANGYLSKEASIEELLDAIKYVLRGEQYIENKLRDKLLSSYVNDEQHLLKLSIREKQVLELICAGETTSDIATKLFISFHTVQSHHKNIMHKFKVKRTSDLIVYAIKHGLV